MSPPFIRNFTIHGTAGYSVLDKNWLDWVAKHSGVEGFGPENYYGFCKATHYTWLVDGQEISRTAILGTLWHELPDSTGFICFEFKRNVHDNCTLLDAYGKERMRLSVPWELTGRDIPKGAEMWFRCTSTPYTNPKTGESGQFGVTAWIEYGGDYYFELDYHTGKFLWGKEIRF